MKKLLTLLLVLSLSVSCFGLGLNNNLLTVTDAGDVNTVGWTDYFASSTVVGWSSYTTSVIRYKKIGNLVLVAFKLHGTSDATGATFTLPYTSVDTSVNFGGAMESARDTGSDLTAASRILMSPNSATVTLYSNMSSGAWTAANEKRVQGTFWYEAQ